MPSPNVTTYQALNSVEDLLRECSSPLIQSNDPLVNQQLKYLLREFYETQRSLGPNCVPVVIDMSGASTAEIISVLLSEIRKTNDLVAATSIIEVRQNQSRILAENKKQIEKLEESSKKAKEAAELTKAMGIFKWVMLAVSVLITIISAVVTVCTFGAATKLLVASAILLAISISMVVVTSVPVDDEEHSAMDLASSKLSESIADLSKQEIVKSYGDRWKKMTDAEQEEALIKAMETGQYSSMAIMLTITIIISIVMIVISAGANSGSAASLTASAVGTTATNAASTTASTASTTAARIAETVASAFKQNAAAIAQHARNLNTALIIAKNLATISKTGVQVEIAELHQETAQNQAEANEIKALVRFLQKNNDVLLELVTMLQQESKASYETVANLLKQQHATHRKIAGLASGNYTV